MTEPTPQRRRLPVFALLTAYLVSITGTSVSALAIPWLVLTTTGSASQTGLVVFAEMTPYVVMQAISGPWIDRLGAHRVCSWGNAIAALAVGAIPALGAVGGLSVTALFGLVAVAGAVRGMSDCANSVLVPGTARLAGMPLERVAGLNAGANRAGLLIGAPLAGVLLSVMDPATVLLVDAVSFAVAAVLIGALVPTSAEPDTTPDRPRYLAALGQGLGFVRADRLILGLVAMIALTNLLDQALFAVILPVWVRDLQGSPEALGLIAGSIAVGALVGSGMAAWLGPRLPRRATYGVGFFVAGAPLFFALAFTSTLWLPTALGLLAGLTGGAINPILSAIWYERIPPHLLARVLGAIKASAWIGIPLGPLVGGLLTETFGLQAALLITGAMMVLATLPPFVFPVFAGYRPVPTVSMALIEALRGTVEPRRRGRCAATADAIRRHVEARSLDAGSSSPCVP